MDLEPSEVVDLLQSAAKLLHEMNGLLQRQQEVMIGLQTALAEAIAENQRLNSQLMASQAEAVRLGNQVLGKNEDM
jgi:hypothetical protein